MWRRSLFRLQCLCLLCLHSFVLIKSGINHWVELNCVLLLRPRDAVTFDPFEMSWVASSGIGPAFHFLLSRLSLHHGSFLPGSVLTLLSLPAPLQGGGGEPDRSWGCEGDRGQRLHGDTGGRRRQHLPDEALPGQPASGWLPPGHQGSAGWGNHHDQWEHPLWMLSTDIITSRLLDLHDLVHVLGSCTINIDFPSSICNLYIYAAVLS